MDNIPTWRTEVWQIEFPHAACYSLSYLEEIADNSR